MKRRGRPKLVNFACPNCGHDGLACKASFKQGKCRVRYYRCKRCGHRGVLVSGLDRDWWRDSGRLKSMAGKCE